MRKRELTEAINMIFLILTMVLFGIGFISFVLSLLFLTLILNYTVRRRIVGKFISVIILSVIYFIMAYIISIVLMPFAVLIALSFPILLFFLYIKRKEILM